MGGSFNAGRGAGIPGNHVGAGRGQAPSRGFVNAGRGSHQSPSGYGNQAGAESFRTYVNAGSESSFRPANTVKEQGPSSNARGGAGNGRRTSLMPQTQPGVPLIDFDSDDYSSDDEPQRGPPPPVRGFPEHTIPGVSPVSTATGTAGARPMVGGFAAAAYEAARAHHFATKEKLKQTK